MTTAQLEYQGFLRQDIRDSVNRQARQHGLSHSFVWRRLYLSLEAKTGFRVPAKDGLQAVEDAGLLEVLHSLASGPNEGTMI